jgi:hypothetical protein
LENVEVKCAEDSKKGNEKAIAYSQDVLVKVITCDYGKRDGERLNKNFLPHVICERDESVGDDHEEVRSKSGPDGFYFPKIIYVRRKVGKVFPTEVFHPIENPYIIRQRRKY